MRSRSFAPGIVLLMLGVTACGSNSTSSSSSSRAKRAAAPQIYRVALAGSAPAPKSAPAARGTAVIAVHGHVRVCWRFAHLHGFTNAMSAEIRTGRRGASGRVVLPLSTGPRLHHRGCVPVTATLAAAIERRPGDYYVSIDSTRHPRGAVRGQL